MKSLTLILLLVLSPLAKADDPAISITVSEVTKGKGDYCLTIKNNSPDSAGYYGYGGEGSMQPIFSVAVYREGAWQRNSGLWCGTGTGMCMLDPNEVSETSFGYELSRIADGVPFRVSIEVPNLNNDRDRSARFLTVLSPVYAKNGKAVEQGTAPNP